MICRRTARHQHNIARLRRGLRTHRTSLTSVLAAPEAAMLTNARRLIGCFAEDRRLGCSWKFSFVKSWSWLLKGFDLAKCNRCRLHCDGHSQWLMCF
jgi:hypothetical protein